MKVFILISQDILWDLNFICSGEKEEGEGDASHGSVFYLENSQQNFLTSQWPELGLVALLGGKGGWESDHLASQP